MAYSLSLVVELAALDSLVEVVGQTLITRGSRKKQQEITGVFI